ncbi:MAG: PqqD family protein [Candidatus Aminicenantia bacterium]
MDFAKHVKIRKEKFGSVIFETLREKVFVTNTTGSDILRLIGEGKALNEIIEILSDEYNEDPANIDQEVVSFIDELKENDILI